MLRDDFEKKDELIEAALEEFSEKDFESASINQIIKNSGMSKGAFYYNFLNKEDLFFYLIDLAAKKKIDFLNNYKDNENVDFQDIFSILKEKIKVANIFISENQLIYKFSLKLLNQKNSSIFDKILDKYGPQTEDFMKPMVLESFEKGVFDPKYPPDFIVRVISYFFINYSKLFGEETESLESVSEKLDLLISFLKSGFEKK